MGKSFDTTKVTKPPKRCKLYLEFLLFPADKFKTALESPFNLSADLGGFQRKRRSYTPFQHS